MIKQNIKKFKFVEYKWISTNPCLEVVLPTSQEPVRLWVRGFGFDNYSGGIEPPYQGFYERRHETYLGELGFNMIKPYINDAPSRFFTDISKIYRKYEE